MALGLVLGGCTLTNVPDDVASGVDAGAGAAAATSGRTSLRPQARPAGLRRLPGAQNAALGPDAALTPNVQDSPTPPAKPGQLGVTIASLGDATQPGFWLRTPLVTAAQKGRVSYAATGRSVDVDLIPIEGAETAGSRISLQAMMALGAGLTDLPELTVAKR
jgi:hypothetical protein